MGLIVLGHESGPDVDKTVPVFQIFEQGSHELEERIGYTVRDALFSAVALELETLTLIWTHLVSICNDGGP